LICSGYVKTSSDGSTWSSVQLPSGVAGISYIDNLYQATGIQGMYYTSKDAVNWNQQGNINQQTTFNWMASDGYNYVAVSYVDNNIFVG
jgi:hypothetical protein